MKIYPIRVDRRYKVLKLGTKMKNLQTLYRSSLTLTFEEYFSCCSLSESFTEFSCFHALKSRCKRKKRKANKQNTKNQKEKKKKTKLFYFHFYNTWSIQFSSSSVPKYSGSKSKSKTLHYYITKLKTLMTVSIIAFLNYLLLLK